MTKVRMDRTQQVGPMEHAALMTMVSKDVDQLYEENCVKPKAGVKQHLPKTVRVSVQPGYEDTLA